MSLKLFRSTGYHSILGPGETRAATHPRWIILVASLWAGFACNVGLWRQLMEPGMPGLLHSFAIGLGVASASATVLSLLGWHKTLKPAATLLLLLSALAACGAWSQPAPPPGSLGEIHLFGLARASWPVMMRWQPAALALALVVPPVAWVWNATVLRLAGPRQLQVNLSGMMAGGALAVASAWLLYRGLV